MTAVGILGCIDEPGDAIIDLVLIVDLALLSSSACPGLVALLVTTPGLPSFPFLVRLGLTTAVGATAAGAGLLLQEISLVFVGVALSLGNVSWAPLDLPKSLLCSSANICLVVLGAEDGDLTLLSS